MNKTVYLVVDKNGKPLQVFKNRETAFDSMILSVINLENKQEGDTIHFIRPDGEEDNIAVFEFRVLTEITHL